jgi:hypothetical protein
VFRVLSITLATLGAISFANAAVAKLAANGASLNGTSLDGTSLNSKSVNDTSLNGTSVRALRTNPETITSIVLPSRETIGR